MPELAGRLYVPTLYRIESEREPVVDLLERSVVASGGRVLYSSFRDQQVAPIYLGAEDGQGGRFGLLVYPFTTTRRVTTNRPPDERRSQIRFGDPVRARNESNLIAHDVAGVDVTLVLAVDPENEFLVGLDPLIYEDLPMGISVYYRDRHVDAASATGWAVWERRKTGGKRRPSWVGIETIVGFHPSRFLDYVRFEAKATALGLEPGLRYSLAETFADPSGVPHHLETFFGLGYSTILDIIEANFRLGIAVRGGVAEHHLERTLRTDPSVRTVKPIDEDGQPDFRLELTDGRIVMLECKTASSKRYKNGDYKLDFQKTRDSAAGRKYAFDQFDIVAACLFSATGLWEFRFRWTRDLLPWASDPARIKPMQRIDDRWASTLAGLVHSSTQRDS